MFERVIRARPYLCPPLSVRSDNSHPSLSPPSSQLLFRWNKKIRFPSIFSYRSVASRYMIFSQRIHYSYVDPLIRTRKISSEYIRDLLRDCIVGTLFIIRREISFTFYIITHNEFKLKYPLLIYPVTILVSFHLLQQSIGSFARIHQHPTVYTVLRIYVALDRR